MGATGSAMLVREQNAREGGLDVISQLSAIEIAQAVQGLGEVYGRYTAAIISHNISGTALSNMNEEEINECFNAIGVESKDHRKAIATYFASNEFQIFMSGNQSSEKSVLHSDINMVGDNAPKDIVRSPSLSPRAGGRNGDNPRFSSSCNAVDSATAAPIASPILVIDFNDFKRRTEFPRYPENRNLCIDVNSIDRSNSFVVFVSHCWLRGWDGALGWNGRPHPDNTNNDKFKLCVEGIGKAFKILAPGATRCYLWLDFGCINQDGNPAMALEQLDDIMRISDCIFTPIHGGQGINTRKSIDNWYLEYKAPAWNEGPFSYIDRGWCRVEMLYAATVPLTEDKVRAEGLFQHGFKAHILKGIRPHLLFGTSEKSLPSPHILPPLQTPYFSILDPSKGHFSVPSDRQKVEELFRHLQPYIRAAAKVGYEGDLDNSGRRSGFGTFRYESGDVYEGEWLEGMKSGKGIYRFSFDDIYEGGFFNGKKSGQGVYRYNNGSVYDGNYENNVMSGFGKFTYPNGTSYEGNWENGEKCGFGKCNYKNGDSYEGYFEEGVMNGMGTYRTADGRVRTGKFLDDEFVG